MGGLLDFQEPMVDGVDIADIVDTVDTLEERGLPMLNLRPKLNPRLRLMLNLDTMDIHPPMDTMVDIIPVLMDLDTMDTDILERDPLMAPADAEPEPQYYNNRYYNRGFYYNGYNNWGYYGRFPGYYYY